MHRGRLTTLRPAREVTLNKGEKRQTATIASASLRVAMACDQAEAQNYVTTQPEGNLTLYNKMKKTTPKITKERAIQIAANHNCVSKEIAATYTNSELKEVLRQLKLKAGF